MADFTGAKCEYCKKIFTSTDDVVVCPDCGTPYHRECYLEAGECVNYELHEKGGDWEQFYGDRVDFENKDGETSAEIRCPRCGTSNPPSGLFCVKCGMPLNSNQEARPFNSNPYGNGQENNPYGNQNTFGGGMYGQQTINLREVDIDGHTGEEYGKFVKKSPVYFIANFFNFSRNKTKTSFNVPAILFPQYYFFYRKMYLVGILLLIFSVVTSIPTMLLYLLDGFEGVLPDFATLQISVPQVLIDNKTFIEELSMYCSIPQMIVSVLCGLFANYWYFNKAKKTLTEIKNMDATEEEKNAVLEKKGGTSGFALAVSVTVNVIAVLLLLLVMLAILK